MTEEPMFDEVAVRNGHRLCIALDGQVRTIRAMVSSENPCGEDTVIPVPWGEVADLLEYVASLSASNTALRMLADATQGALNDVVGRVKDLADTVQKRAIPTASVDEIRMALLP